MGKMFYTLDEAAAKLGKTQDEVKAMVTSGQLQEFRDRDSLMFKVDQVDLLSDEGIDEDIDLGHSPNEMSSMIPLADSFGGDLGGSVLPLADDSGIAGGLGSDDDDTGASAFDAGGDDSMSDLLAASGTGGGLGGGFGGGLLGESEELNLDSGLDDMLEGSSLMSASDQSKTGVSIFDADELDQADPSAVTQMTNDGGLDDLNLDPIGSGSGLMDLTRESDDTSLGAEFLEEVYPGEEGGGEGAAAASGAGAAGGGGGGLFGGEEELAVAGGPALQLSGTVITAEPYDGGGSGLAAGLSLGAILAMAVGLTSVIFGMMGVGDGGVLGIVTDNFVPVMGGLLGATLLFGIIGWALGKRG
ncbi:MAG: hypothetical protein H6813_03575 [Phycisphaeraceae bacterium]|nr:hypothetical protein [Phycisphaeraceae bacterium]MCB9847027.1 hypothetical protein [Phycisphaeraceae bacterium]